MSWNDADPDPARASAARELSRLTIDRYLTRAQRHLQERHALPREWRAVTGVNQSRLDLTPDELKELEDGFLELALGRFGGTPAAEPRAACGRPGRRDPDRRLRL